LIRPRGTENVPAETSQPTNAGRVRLVCLGHVARETIHDSVIVHDDLSKRWLSNLGNDTAGAWVVLEALTAETIRSTIRSA